MTNLSLVFQKIRPGSSYLLTSSEPPHSVVEWRGPGSEPTQQEIESAWSEIQGQFFRDVLCFNSADVDNVVSAAIKEAIAPGRPANLQGEAEKALLAKIGALTAKTALGLTLTAEEQAYLAEKLTFYSAVVQPIRDEGDAFIAARGW